MLDFLIDVVLAIILILLAYLFFTQFRLEYLYGMCLTFVIIIIWPVLLNRKNDHE